MIWGEKRWPQMQALNKEKAVVVIPTGSMEQHGPHLPLQVDHYIAGRLAEDLEKRRPDVLVLPPVWAGVSPHHMDFSGSITVRPRVFIDLLYDICSSIQQHGFQKIVLLNGHGGNRSSLEVLTQELYARLGLSINLIVYWDLVPDLVKAMKKSPSKGMGHSGELETSLMLYLAPNLVSKKDIPSETHGERQEEKKRALFTSGVKRYVNIREHSTVGVDGNPAAATLEDGEKFYQAVLSQLETAIDQIRHDR